MTRSRLLALAAAAPASGAARPVRAQNAALRIGTSAIDGYLEPYYALDQGLFGRAGIDADVQLFSGGARVTQAVAAGAIDVGITNPISAANALDHGVQLLYIAGGVLYNRDAIALCVAADSPLRKAQDLNGKTIATTALEDSNTLHVRGWVDQNGGDSSTLQFVEIPFSAMGPAVARGTVVAAPIAEPALTPALRDGSLRIFAHTMDVYGRSFMIGGWIARAEWIARNRETARRFAAVMYDTARWANAHQDVTALTLVKYAKIDIAVVRSMNRSRCAETLTPGMMQACLDLGYKYKFFSRQLRAQELIARL